MSGIGDHNGRWALAASQGPELCPGQCWLLGEPLVEGEFATLTQLLWPGSHSFQAAESGCGLFADSSADVYQISTG